MIGEAAPALLTREREELDAVALPLREGRRIVAFLVSKAALRPVILGYLCEKSGVAIPEPTMLDEPGHTLDALTEAASRPPDEVRAFAINHEAADVLRTLNWHREKLRRGASVLLWIDGVDGLRALRTMGPDAYSFRDVTAIVQGEEPVTVMPPKEKSIEVQVARMHYEKASSPRKRAEASVEFADALQVHRSLDELRAITQRALAELSREAYPDEAASVARAGLYVALASLPMGQLTQAWRWVNCGLSEVDRSTSVEGCSRRLDLLGLVPSPLNVDHAAAKRALGEILSVDRPWLRPPVLLYAARSRRIRGDLREASRLLRDALAPARFPSDSQASVILEQGHVSYDAGRLSAAEEHYRAASLLDEEAGLSTVAHAWGLATCAVSKGEHEAARHVLEGIRSHLGSNDADAQFFATRALAELRVNEGDVARGLAEVRVLIHESAAASCDGYLFSACVSYVTYLHDAHQAVCLSPDDLINADAELAVAEDVALSISGEDPPWYKILFPGLRAEILALRPDRLANAIALAEAALERARATWPDAIPMHARVLIDLLLRAGRLDEALAALAVAEPEVEAQRHLRELARLRALAVAALVRTSAPTAAIDAKMASLRATLDETDAPRIAADTLLELALLLPTGSSHPDPLELLEEADLLFLDMPIPAQEARCLETMGDVLAARGSTADARRRYLTAKATYERFGLGLRVPLVSTKLDRLGSPIPEP